MMQLGKLQCGRDCPAAPTHQPNPRRSAAAVEMLVETDPAQTPWLAVKSSQRAQPPIKAEKRDAGPKGSGKKAPSRRPSHRPHSAGGGTAPSALPRLGGVGVRAELLAAGAGDNVDEAAVVEHALARAARRLLLLLLLLHLGRLALHLTRTRKRTVNLAHF